MEARERDLVLAAWTGAKATYAEAEAPDSLRCVRSAQYGSKVVLQKDRGGALLVCCRGTQSREEMVADAVAKLVPLGTVLPDLVHDAGGARVHWGFGDVARALAEGVAAAVADCGPGSDELVLTGHSLGGAVAVLLALSLQCRGVAATFQRTRIITFGAPPPGDAALRRLVEASGVRVDRYELFCDPVPRSLAWSGDFEHVGRSVDLETAGKTLANVVTVASSVAAWFRPQAAAPAPSFWETVQNVAAHSVGFHSVDEYDAHLRSFLFPEAPAFPAAPRGENAPR